MSTAPLNTVSKSWPSVPLSQATTLCGSENEAKPGDASVAKKDSTPFLSIPTLAYFGRSTSYTSEASDLEESHTVGLTRVQRLRASDFTIVLVCAYCLFYQIFACTLFSPVIPSRLEDIGVKEVAETTGYLSSVWAAGNVFIAPIAGWLPSVYKNKRIQLIVYVSALIAASVLFAFVPSVAGLMAGRLLHGIGSSGAWTIAMSLLNDNVTPSRLGRMTGIAQVGYAIGNSVSPTMGGAIFQGLGWLALCYFAIGLGALNLLLCLLYLPKISLLDGANSASSQRMDDKSAQTDTPPTLRLASILKITLCNPRYLVGITIALIWGAFTNGILYTALPIRLEERYGLSSQEVGFSSLAIAGPNIVFAPLAGWMTDRLGARPLMLTCLASFALWNALMCIDALPYAAFLVIMSGVGTSASFVATPTIVHWTKVDRLYGSPVGASLICGIYCMAASISSLVFPLISSAVLGGVGISIGWKILLGVLTGALLSCLAFVYCYMRLPEVASARDDVYEIEAKTAKNDTLA